MRGGGLLVLYQADDGALWAPLAMRQQKRCRAYLNHRPPAALDAEMPTDRAGRGAGDEDVAGRRGDAAGHAAHGLVRPVDPMAPRRRGELVARPLGISPGLPLGLREGQRLDP